MEHKEYSKDSARSFAMLGMGDQEDRSLARLVPESKFHLPVAPAPHIAHAPAQEKRDAGCPPVEMQASPAAVTHRGQGE